MSQVGKFLLQGTQSFDKTAADLKLTVTQQLAVVANLVFQLIISLLLTGPDTVELGDLGFVLSKLVCFDLFQDLSALRPS